MTKVRADRTVIVIGVFLFILGLAVAWNGYGYVRDERGWTLVISGTVAFSTGLLLVALGLVLRELRAIAASAGRATLLLAKAKTLQIRDFDEDSFPAAPPPPAPMAPPPLPPRAYEPEKPAAAAFAPVEETPAKRETDWKAERALRLHLPRVDEVAAGAVASRPPNPLAWMVRPEKPEPVPPPAPRQAEKFESWLEPAEDETFAQELPEEPPLREPPVETLRVAEMPAEPPEAEDLSGSLDAPEPAPQTEAQFAPEHEPASVMELAPEPKPEPAPEIEPEHELEPAPQAAAAEEAAPAEVIGHYEAHGAHYTMYADGSIDADTTHGVYRFASMEELKQFIARQE
jgi:hypothetical protein